MLLLVLVLQFTACDTLNQIAGDFLEEGGGLSNVDVANGLKQALEIGITDGATKLSKTDGFFKSSYKIFLPDEARKVTDKLQGIPGFSNLEDIILEKINRGAEDATKKAVPIFKSAITSMTFSDAMNILMGNKDAATQYLHKVTYNQLYQEFNPVIVKSLDKFNARDYWSDAVGAYNNLPFVTHVNDDLDDHVTTKALEGLFDMIEKKELDIRTNFASRTTDLLRKVFAKQD